MKLGDGNWPKSTVCSIRPMSLLLASLVLVSLILAGCSQHEGVPTSEEAASPDQHLPFDATSDKGGIFPTGSLSPTVIPAGTPLAVRLRTSLSSATARPGDSFEAVLDEPIVVRGKILALRGANVTGKVLDAKAAGELQEPGYMRLALTAVFLNGQPLPIQTSSIFVKRGAHHERNSTMLAGAATGGGTANNKGALIGTSVDAAGMPYPTGNKDVGIAPERRLTFRLAQPIPLEI